MRSAYPADGLRRLRRWATHATALGLLAATLGACQTSRETTASVPPPSNDYRQRHPIAVVEKDQTVLLFVGRGRGGLTPAQRADVLAFVQAWKREASGGIIIDMPVRTPNERAAADTLPEIQSILVGAGVPPNGVRVATYQPSDPSRLATIKLNYPRMAATAGPCGQWPDDLGSSFSRSYIENRPYYNLGCAMQRNLASMVDNPADLVQPRGETPVYNGRRTTVLDKYRKGEATATVDPNANKGTISDVGK